MSGGSEDEKEIEKPLVAKSAVDLQRLKLMKLMKNPEKPVMIPERPKPKNTPGVPEFVRNVMGSSAGAGSGEFHVYRHLRRKEYARQKCIQEKGHIEQLDDEYHQKLEENKRLAEEMTAKKRAKRLKKKQKYQNKKKLKPSIKNESNSIKSDSEDNSSDEEKNNDFNKINEPTVDETDKCEKQIHNSENVKKESEVETKETLEKSEVKEIKTEKISETEKQTVDSVSVKEKNMEDKTDNKNVSDSEENCEQGTMGNVDEKNLNSS